MNHKTHHELAAKNVKHNIIQTIQDNGFYTTLMDEKIQADSSRSRWHNVWDLQPNWRFVNYSEKTNPETLYGHIKQFWSNVELPIVAELWRAAVMSGHMNGIQKKVGQDQVSAVYINCMAHKRNLVFMDVCKVISQ